jgi:predicted ATPase/DNA-binding XRE family transcriptional regulator
VVGDGATSLAGVLRGLREVAGLSQEELAQRAGLSTHAVSALERGTRTRPYPHTLRALARALELDDADRTRLIAAVPPRTRPVRTAADAATGRPRELPVPPTPLLGREDDVRRIGALLAARRLVTLSGPGGVGKSRLALAVADRFGDRYADGVALVELAPLLEASAVLPAIADAVDASRGAGRSVAEDVVERLRGQHLLLVLDNVEHLLDAAAEVAALIEAAPGLNVLATSRAPLRVRGETEVAVDPLALPSATTPVSESPAARLLLDRAGAVSPGWGTAADEQEAVAATCVRLAGLPLALELAAARARLLDPAALLARLDGALDGGPRDLPPRQRTMRATLDWSHDLLHEPEKELFRRLSVFAGGFTLETAEEVGAAGAVEAEDVLVLLGNLVEQSLVLAETSPEGTTRYRMLEPVRQYALEKLRESGEADEARGRHVRYYLALAEQAEPHIKGLDQAEWLDRLETENDNLRTAIGWSIETGDAQSAARFGWVLAMYWVMRARHSEGRLWMEQTVARDDLPDELRAKALWALAASVYGSGDDERLMAISEEGVAISRKVQDARAQAYSKGMVGFAALQLGDLDRATRALEESLRLDREQGDDWAAAHILTHLAVVPLRQGNFPQAAAYAEEALELTDRTGDRLAANIALYLLAQTALAAGEHERANAYFLDALVLTFEVSDMTNAAYCLQGLAAVAGAQGEQVHAARLLGAAEALIEAAGTHLYAQMDHELYKRVADAAREQLGERAWTAAHREGRAMSFEEAVSYVREGDEALPKARTETPATE